MLLGRLFADDTHILYSADERHFPSFTAHVNGGASIRGGTLQGGQTTPGGTTRAASQRIPTVHTLFTAAISPRGTCSPSATNHPSCAFPVMRAQPAHASQTIAGRHRCSTGT